MFTFAHTLTAGPVASQSDGRPEAPPTRVSSVPPPSSPPVPTHSKTLIEMPPPPSSNSLSTRRSPTSCCLVNVGVSPGGAAVRRRPGGTRSPRPPSPGRRSEQDRSRRRSRRPGVRRGVGVRDVVLVRDRLPFLCLHCGMSRSSLDPPPVKIVCGAGSATIPVSVKALSVSAKMLDQSSPAAAWSWTLASSSKSPLSSGRRPRGGRQGQRPTGRPLLRPASRRAPRKQAL